MPQPRSPRVAATLALLSLLTTLAGAQTTTRVFPAPFEHAEGASSTGLPFGIKGPVRMQCIYHLDAPAGRPWITEVALRADGTPQSSSPGKQYLTLFLYIGFCPRDFDSLSAEFDENRGSNAVPIVWSQRIALPALAVHAGPGPRGFDLVFPLAQPYFLHPIRDDGRLLLEIVVIDQPDGDYQLDSPFVCESRGTDFAPPGAGCVSTLKVGNQSVPLALTSSNGIRLGGSVTWTLENALPSAPVLFVSGPPVVPPLALDPAPGCFFSVEWFALGVAVASNSRKAGWVLSIPNDRRLRDAWLYAQALTLDLAANQMGVIWSNGRKAQICGPVECARVFQTGDLTQKSGIVQIGSAPILRVKYQ